MQFATIGETADVEIGKKVFRWENVCRNCVCSKNIPGVINFELIEEILRKELLKHESGRMLLENGIPVEKIEEIWIEFRRILRIDHLWMFKNLKKLKLDNNCIEKIENLECLIHLNELDLSFNHISKIENLESFTQLEILSLFANMISVIENMDNLKKLKIFSIGRNRISSLENVAYLRKLPNLKSLNMAENICSSTENFREEYLIMLESEEEEIVKRRQKETEEEEAKLHMECFVEFLNTRRLFESFFEDDSEGKAFLLIGDKVDELHNTYRDSILKNSKNIFDIGQEYYKIRQNEKKSYTSSIEVVIEQSQAESVAHMENFLKDLSELFDVIKSFGHHLERKNESVTFIEGDIKESNEIFEQMLNSIWKVLMKFEIRLNDQMLETNEIYEHFLTDSINAFIEDSQELFSNMRNSIAEYHDELQVIAEEFFSKHHVDEETDKNELEEEIHIPMNSEDDDMVANDSKSNTKLKDTTIGQETRVRWKSMLILLSDSVPAPLKPYIKDRETLMNSLGSSRDLHMLLVDNREDLLISRANDWLKDTVDTLISAEIIRNRDKVIEISMFLQKQREEWESLPVISEAIFRKLLTPPVTDPVGKQIQ
ncbi:hypothetical protein WA026_020130 [Henosepilachna vigintioctopunctata]|uniref:Dynein axonemal assembly factor 1 homolog n=1 Tax=Henosepilachna vigintioctopunctata TaxID=420089 RepID=A0AAW1UAH8_9CUCU